ncbi:MAG TPA: RND transporter, partial [Acinetobacter ursingii]|nr:RND transporter [Acinetobacter ursingii]
MYVHIIQQARRAILPKKVMSIVVFTALLPYSAITMADTEIAQHKNISALEQSS